MSSQPWVESNWSAIAWWADPNLSVQENASWRPARVAQSSYQTEESSTMQTYEQRGGAPTMMHIESEVAKRVEKALKDATASSATAPQGITQEEMETIIQERVCKALGAAADQRTPGQLTSRLQRNKSAAVSTQVRREGQGNREEHR